MVCATWDNIYYNGSGEDILLTKDQVLFVDVSHYRDPKIARMHNQGFRLENIIVNDSIPGTDFYKVKNNDVITVGFSLASDSDASTIFVNAKFFSINYMKVAFENP